MKKKKKNIVLLIFCVFLIGFTIAYYFSNSSNINQFSLGKYSIVTYEVFTPPTNWGPGDVTPKEVYAKNEGTIPAAVRISYTEEWKDENGDVIDPADLPNNLVTINFTQNSNWVKSGNYYYYSYILDPNGQTTSLIQSVTLNPNIMNVSCTEENGVKTCTNNIDDFKNAKYKLTFKIETVQSDAYKQIWNTNIQLTEKQTGAKLLISKSTNTTNTLEPVKISHVKTDQLAATIDFRYMGANPNNYILFNCESEKPQEQTTGNCEVWRIIGVFNNQIKIIKDDSIGTMYWDTNDNTNWAESSLYDYLNDDYYYGLNQSAKKLISTSNWYLGGWGGDTRMDEVEGLYYDPDWYESWDDYVAGNNNELYTTIYGYSIFPEGAYKAERSNDVNGDNPKKVNAKVGLIYTSDYAYTSSECYSTCVATSSTCGSHMGNYALSQDRENYYYYNGEMKNALSYSANICINSSWMSSKEDGWTITNYYYTDQSYSDYIHLINSYTSGIWNEEDVYPTLYLDIDTKLVGTGTQANPYKASK